MRTIRTFRELIFLASIFILQSELQQQSQKFSQKMGIYTEESVLSMLATVAASPASRFMA